MLQSLRGLQKSNDKAWTVDITIHFRRKLTTIEGICSDSYIKAQYAVVKMHEDEVQKI